MSETRLFSISEGRASVKLREFARQAEVEIIYDPLSLEDVTTNAVAGEMLPQAALKLLIADTGLTFSIDPDSHALAIRRMESAP